MNVLPFAPLSSAPTVRCEQCYGDGVILMLGQEEKCTFCGGCGWYRPAPRRDAATLSDALSMWSTWHLDVPPCDETGDFTTDLRLADAFRMLVYLRERPAQRAWLEREVFGIRAGIRRADDYATAMMRWWLCLYDEDRAG